jgi:hypothetical protein
MLQGVDTIFRGYPTVELCVVMICCPLLLNICQVGLSHEREASLPFEGQSSWVLHHVCRRWFKTWY